MFTQNFDSVSRASQKPDEYVFTILEVKIFGKYFHIRRWLAIVMRKHKEKLLEFVGEIQKCKNII